MSDIILDDLKSGYNLNTINVNFDKIEKKINEELIHNKGNNNVLEQDLDLNSNRILNLPAPATNSEPLRKGDIVTNSTGATVQYVDDYTDARIDGKLVKEFDTIAAASASTSLVIGDVLLIADRANSHWDVVDTTTVTANTFNIVASTGQPSISFVLRTTDVINPASYGISPDNLDNSEAWQSLLDSKPSHIHFSIAGNYKFLSSSTHDTSITITSVPGVIIDCTDASYVGSNWTKFSGAFPQIENLGVDAVKGSRTLTFASTPSLKAGDVFVIFNPTASSWSAFRTNYFAGEFCRVVSVAGSIVTIAGELYDDYVFNAVNVYRLDGIRVALGSLTVNGYLSTSLIDLEFCRDSLLHDIKSNHKNNSCISIARCFNTVVNDPTIHNEGDGGDDYGIAVSNSQSIKITGGDVYSRRHAITTGGDSSVGAVPCRDLKFSNLTLSNDVNSGVHCADFHGNTEDSQYINCEIYGGATWQGKNNGYVNCRIGSLLFGGCIISAEVLGGRLYAENCNFHTTTNPQLSSRSVWDIGSNSVAVSTETAEDVTFEIIGGELNASNFTSNTVLMDMRNRGSVNKINLKVSGVDLKVNDINSIIRTELVSGVANSDFIIVDDITYSGVKNKLLCNHAASAYRDFPHKLQQQAGTENLSFTSSDNFVTGTPISFNWVYPRMPSLSTGRGNKLFAGADQPIESASSISASGLTMAVGTVDAANFTVSTNVDIGWRVSIDEV